MYDYIKTMHMGLTDDRVIRIVLLRNDWEVTIKASDDIWDDNDGKLLIIEHENGRRAIINIDHISMVCTMTAGRRYYE